ncbi:BON domain-containing protein [Candidatus Vallotia cooleyia]|uniref:BON domain-containing protein n=1 Tax=Candidatus Vallotiella adelgis TaxID=1177211 RepID=UPI001D004EB2|nr:BON domain-containing protein [Candidatus Vallotia cooleyia]UDG82563.1 Osmotically-inducible protein OsmY [Candidatus Vallotia cooleyia]
MTVTRFCKTLMHIVLAVGLSSSLQGCGLLLLGSAAGGTLMCMDRRTFGAQTEDREIQIKAWSRLSHALPDSTHVNLTVYNRRVLLTGEAPDAASKKKVGMIVRDITNVTGIINKLAVQPESTLFSRTIDTYISGKVHAVLISRKDIESNHYKWTTERGIVYLMGLVTVDEGNRGADAISYITGVRQVVKLFQYVQPENLQLLVITPIFHANSDFILEGEQPMRAAVGEVPLVEVTVRPLDQ